VLGKETLVGDHLSKRARCQVTRSTEFIQVLLKKPVVLVI
jgi:hypothetical protein